MENTKKTLTDKFNEVLNILNEKGATEEAAFIQEQIDKIQKAADKAKERRAKVKAEDPYIDTVKAALTDVPRTAADIVAEIGTDELTRGKIVARLTKLVTNGDAVTEEVKGEKGKVKGYKLAD